MSANVVKEKLLHLPLDSLISNRYQPRRQFVSEDIEELARSIQEVGLLHPPLVRFLPASDQYEIIAGERRVMACRLLGYSHIPAIIRDSVDHLEAAKAALVENMQRVDLNPVEIAISIRAMMQEFDLNQEMLAEHIGKKRSTVANYVRLLQLPAKIQESLAQGVISMAHAKIILSCAEKNRWTLFEEIRTKALTVRQASERAKSLIAKQPGKRMQMTGLKEVQERLQEMFGTKVRIEGSHAKGRVEIHYYGLEDLDRLLNRLSETVS